MALLMPQYCLDSWEAHSPTAKQTSAWEQVAFGKAVGHYLKLNGVLPFPDFRYFC